MTAVIKVVAPRPTLNLMTTTVAGIRFGTPAAAMEAALRRQLGPPTAVYNYGCEITGVWAKSLSWGTGVSVVLSNSITGNMTLSGWTVRQGTSRHRVVLPFNVGVGTPLNAASAALRCRSSPSATSAAASACQPCCGSSTGKRHLHGS